MSAEYDPNNIFAKILRGELPCEKLYEDEATLAFMDIMPRGEGHCMVIPKAPSRNLLDASDEALAAVMKTVKLIAKAAKTGLHADGIQIEQFNEPASGQTVYHLHVHIIPRFDGVPLKAHAGSMEDKAVLAANAEKIRAAL